MDVATQIIDQTANVTLPRKPTEEFLMNVMDQLAQARADSNETTRSETIDSIIREFHDSLALVRLPDNPAVAARVAQIVSRLNRGDIPPALTADEVDTKFAAHLSK